MGQHQSQYQQPQSVTPSAVYQLPSHPHDRGSKRSFSISVGRGNSIYHSPVKYGGSSIAVPATVPETRFSLESDEDENPAPAIFQRQIIHSVEHLEYAYQDPNELSSEEDVPEPPTVEYEDEITLAYRKSRRISRLGRSKEYAETDIYISRRDRRARIKWESILSKQGTGGTSDVHRDGGGTIDMYKPLIPAF